MGGAFQSMMGGAGRRVGGNSTMENQVQMLSIRYKRVRSPHPSQPWRITMKWIGYTHLSHRCRAWTQETILNVTLRDELPFKKLQKNVEKDVCT